MNTPTEKNSRAQQLVDEGLTNKGIQAKIKDEFGGGISTSALARMRGGPKRKSPAETPKDTRRFALAKQLLKDGLSNYACGQACRARFGVGVGHIKLENLRREIRIEAEEPVKEDIVPVDLPADLMDEPEAVEATETEILEVTGPAEPKVAGATEPEKAEVRKSDPGEFPDTEFSGHPDVDFPQVCHLAEGVRYFQRWMQDTKAESLTLTQEGLLSVLIRRDINFGRLGE